MSLPLPIIHIDTYMKHGAPCTGIQSVYVCMPRDAHTYGKVCVRCRLLLAKMLTVIRRMENTAVFSVLSLAAIVYPNPNRIRKRMLMRAVDIGVLLGSGDKKTHTTSSSFADVWNWEKLLAAVVSSSCIFRFAKERVERFAARCAHTTDKKIEEIVRRVVKAWMHARTISHIIGIGPRDLVFN